ncbi:MAG: hypothetical protein WAM89_08770 [Terriglobales bacterium]
MADRMGVSHFTRVGIGAARIMTAVEKTSRPPRPKLAVPPEVKEQLKRLNSASPSGVSFTSTVDAADALDILRGTLERVPTPITVNAAKNICNRLKRSALRKPRKAKCTIKYDERTIRATLAVLTQLVPASLKSMSRPETDSPRKQKKGAKALMPLVTLCLETLVVLCERAEHELSWKYCMEYVSSVADLTNASSNELLQESASNLTFLAIKQGLIGGLRNVLSKGQIGEADLLLASVRSHTSLRQVAADSLRALLQNESARLPVASQEWILTTLGIEGGARQLSYANPADAPEIRQAAGLLLLLSDNSADSPLMCEAFERFRTLCEKHFHLYLRGQSGEVADYDSRLHELTGADSRRVRVTRPWVEFLDPPHSAIVIRALATPA